MWKGDEKLDPFIVNVNSFMLKTCMRSTDLVYQFRFPQGQTPVSLTPKNALFPRRDNKSKKNERETISRRATDQLHSITSIQWLIKLIQAFAR